MMTGWILVVSGIPADECIPGGTEVETGYCGFG